MALQSNKAGPSRSTLSSNHGGFEYDVFLSFRGKDTRHNFTGLLRDMLYLRCIRAFFDEEDLHKGERIEEILVAISKSKIMVPIFSKRYAESQWCLREVAKMVECHKDGAQERLIIPVFFDIDPKDVWNHSGPFKDAFQKHQTHQTDNSSEVEGWKQALEYVGRIRGFHLNNGNHRELMSSIAAEIEKVLPIKKLRYEGGYHVGLEIRVEKMMKCLDFQAKDVRLIGIHGIGGIGKTTLANAIYNRSHRFFEACSFVENVREISKSSQGLVHLQQQLIRDISNGQRNNVINNPSEGTQMIIDMVGIKSVLLVLDDVDDRKMLEALAASGAIRWFKSGSRIIITTRQKEILEFAGLRGDAVYMLEELDKQESLQLFKYHAFGDQEPQEEYIKLSKEVVSISNGLPLVLQVFGSLFKTAETPEECDKLLKDLRTRRQVGRIHEKLRICYDSLNWNEQYIFLDIACLLVGKSSEDAIYIWEGYNLLPRLAIRSLQNRSLIKINKGKFEMHDQIRDMGREIVMRESPIHPQKCSRLWCEEDVVKALTKLQPQGNMIQGILLNSREEGEAKFGTEAFQLMSEIRILLINLANLSHCDFRHLPAGLKWLEWKGCPLPTLPLESEFKSLVVLNLSHSFISQLWSETATRSSSRSTKELFDGLKVLDLSCCGCLNATPNFAMAPNLEKLILDECNMLKQVDSIGSLKKLVFLSIRECVSLEKLPNEIYGLSSLVVFNLEGCSNLVTFPQFPPKNSTIGFSKLEQLILRDCQSLEVLPDLHKFQCLRSLHIDGCQHLDHIGKHLFEDVAFREWDELGISGSRTSPYEQEFCFLIPVGSINDPLFLQQLQCHGCGDPCKNGAIKLHVCHVDTDMGNYRAILETMYEAQCDNSMYMGDVYDHCHTINFDWNDKINVAPRGKTIIMKVRPVDNFELTKVDVKIQKRSKLSGENMKTFISISRRYLQPELSIFFNLQEADKLYAIKYSTRMQERKNDMKMQLNVPCGEQRLFYDWTIEELIIVTMILVDIEPSWYEQLRHGTGLPRQETTKVFDKIKVLDLSCCKFLDKTPDLARLRNLEELILDHCECLPEISESIEQLKHLILLSMVGCKNLGALPCGILQLNFLQLLNIEGCSKIKILPEVSMMDVGLESLQQLILDNCTSLTEIPDYVGGLKCLRRLSLKGCSSLKRLPFFIGSLVVLEELILDNCKCLLEVGEFVGQLNNLTLLSMVGCANLGALPRGILQLNCLQLINLEGCSKIKILPEASMMDVGLESLQQLILDKSTSLMEIPDYVGGLKCLHHLSLKGCSSLKRLPFSIGCLVVLEELILDNCTSLKEIPNNVGGLKCLRRLSLKRCSSLQRLPRSIGSLVVLEELILDHCKCLLEVGESIGQLNNLTLLSMVGCANLGALPYGILQLNSLQLLNLEDCSKIKMLPQARMRDVWLESLEWLIFDHWTSLRAILNNVGGLKCLRHLSLKGCSLLQQLPCSIGSMVVLEELILDHCKCLLEVGESIGQLNNLTLLTMVGCENLGALPCGILQLNSLQLLSLEGCSRIKTLPEANMMDVRLDSLQRLILDNCTSLTEIPNYVGGLKCLRRLSLKDCFSLQRLPRSIGSLVVLEELILDNCKCLLEVGESIGQLNNLNILSMVGCENLGDLPCGMLQLNSLQVLNLQGCSRIKILPEASMMDVRLETLQRLILDHCVSLTELPDYVVGLKCLRSLSLQGCSSLERISFFIGSLVVLEELILDHCTSLTEMPDLSNLTALEKLNVENCRSLATIPGLQNLTSLKVLYMNGCWDLDVHKIWSELKDATFHNLQAFSIGCKIWHGAKTISLPFPRRGRTRRVPLQLERMDLAVIKMSMDEIMAGGIKVAEDARVLDVGVAVGSRLFPAAEDIEAQQEEASYYRYCRSYTASFGLDDVIMINARLRKDLEAQQEEASYYRYCYSYIARFWKDDVEMINSRLREEATSRSSDYATPVAALHISCQDPTFLLKRANIWLSI